MPSPFTWHRPPPRTSRFVPAGIGSVLPQQYVANHTEAVFACRDFRSYTRQKVEEHGPDVFEVLEKRSGARTEPSSVSKA